MASSYPCPRKTPAHCYPPSEFIPHPTSALLPPHPRSPSSSPTTPSSKLEPETTYRIARRFAATDVILHSTPAPQTDPQYLPETTYRVPRRFAARCYPPAHSEPHHESNLLPATRNSTSPKPVRKASRNLSGFDLHYGLRRKNTPRGFPPVEKNLEDCLNAANEEENRELVGFETHYGRRRISPARCYEPAEEVQHPESALLPALPSSSPESEELVGYEAHYGMKRRQTPRCYPAIGTAPAAYHPDENRPLVGFEVHYGMKRKSPVRCYPPAETTVHPKAALLPALPIFKAQERVEEKDKLVGFELHYGMKRKSLPKGYPPTPATSDEDDKDEVERPLVGFEVHYGMKRLRPTTARSPSTPPASLELQTTIGDSAEDIDADILPIPLAAPPKIPVVLTLTSAPRSGLTADAIHQHMASVNSSLAASMKQYGVTRCHVVYNTSEMKDKLLGKWPSAVAGTEEDDEDWEKVEADGQGGSGKKEEAKETGEVSVQLWFEGEDELKGFCGDEEGREKLMEVMAGFTDMEGARVMVGLGVGVGA
ncbi:hypothetical protein BJ508DRAFT_415672 [Ascobolus immersus RN42]|uniref:Uncharacterized protein n=1 Tax=Ascobolus immersus RN42 TaxID=1160509 RepID=A0A3N4I183_ASCIM|nr:hypothetical protein BJ508DRAFT_415672 [Ascobolus immersus RN42]